MQENLDQGAKSIMSTAQAEALFMSKFCNLSVGEEDGQSDGDIETGSVSDEVEDVFKSIDTECRVCMHNRKVRHQVLLLLQCEFCVV
jgi:hypothetical protein